MAKKTEKATQIVIPPYNEQILELKLVGTSPYVQLKFPEKVKQEMMAKQRLGATAKSKKTRKKRNFEEDYKQAQHRSTEGWCGMRVVRWASR